MVFAKNIVHEALTKVPVIYFRGDRDWALRVRWNAELVTNQYRSPRLDGVVIGDRVDRPDFVIIDESTIDVDRPIGEAVRSLVQHPIRLNKAAMIDLLDPPRPWR